MDYSKLRARLVDIERVAAEDLPALVARPLDGRLVALLYEETAGPEDDTILARLVEATELAPSDTVAALFAAAVVNVRGDAPARVDLLDDGDVTVVMLHTENDPTLSGRILAIADLMADIEPLLPDSARALVDRSRGVLVAVPRNDLVGLFFIASGDLLQGAESLAANAHANYDGDESEAVSPWIYWLDGDRFEEMEYEIGDDDEVESINIPDALR